MRDQWVIDAHNMTYEGAVHDSIESLYKVPKGRVQFVDVPELAFIMIDGAGAPQSASFADALQALFSVSYGAHFALKKATGVAPRVMALEALWWVEGMDAPTAMQRLASGEASAEESDRERWRWRAMIMQLPPIDEALIGRVVEDTMAKKHLASLQQVRFETWREGPSAQILHLGPYATESLSVRVLHEAIRQHGLRPRGRHHEIYLGDPRRSAPEKLRTILRQPTEPLD